MNWIGLKHLILHRLEQFLRLFIPCKHCYDLQMTKEEFADLEKIRDAMGASMHYTVPCIDCGKPAELYIRKEILPEDLQHVCQWCGASTMQPDELCYMNPDNKDFATTGNTRPATGSG